MNEFEFALAMNQSGLMADCELAKYASRALGVQLERTTEEQPGKPEEEASNEFTGVRISRASILKNEKQQLLYRIQLMDKELAELEAGK